MNKIRQSVFPLLESLFGTPRPMIRNMIKEEKVESYIQSPIDIVDLENVNESLKAVL